MIRTIALSSLLGATALNVFQRLPSPWVIVVLIGCGVILVLLLQFVISQPIFKAITVGLLAAAIGFGWTYFYAYQRLHAQIPLAVCYKPHIMSGIVSGIVRRDKLQQQFDLISPEWGKIRLYIRNTLLENNNNNKNKDEDKIHLKAGDRLSLTVKLTYPWRLANPGTFDHEKQLFKEGIAGTGTVIALHDYQPPTGWSITRFRQQLFEQLSQRYTDKPLLPIIQATTLGLYGDMTAHQFEVFAATGTLHAVAISGSHIAMIAWFCTMLITFMTRQSCWLTRFHPAQHYGAVAGMLGAWCYGALAGFGIPTQRALIMILFALWALLQGKKILTWDLLAFAWLGVGCMDPLSVLDNGFWLSFGCVAILILCQSHTMGSWWRRWILPQWCIFIGTIPMSIVFFHQVAFISPIANMLTLPILGFLVVPLSLIGVLLIALSPALADLLIISAHACLTLAWAILEPLASLPLCLSLGFTFSPQVGDCRFTLLDVGQGLSVFVQTAHHTLLFDTGPRYGNDQDAGSRVIKPFLTTQGIKSLDALIISHRDFDHRGGWASLQNMPIKTIYSSEPENIAPEAISCHTPISWEWDGIRFTLFSAKPKRPMHTPPKRHQRNNDSCLLKIQGAHQSVLITGDIEKTAESQLVKECSHLLPSNILVVPHHGSLTSSSDGFVAAVSPQYALYAAGFHNRFGFPRREIKAKYAQMGAQNRVSYETGAMTFLLGPTEKLTPPTCWRDTHRHYWDRS